MGDLRSFIFLDRLQPQTLCYLGTWIKGSLPRAGDAAQVIEVAPGLDLEIHGPTSSVRSAAGAVLDHLDATSADATAPQVLASKVVSRIDPQHAFLINRNKMGSMVLAGETLFVMEMQPASYAILATNEAEKAARIKVVDYRMIGATGRVYLSGVESEVRAAAEAAEAALGVGVGVRGYR